MQWNEWWKKACVCEKLMNEVKFTPKTKENYVFNLALGEMSLIDANGLENLIDELLELPFRDAC